MAEDEDTFERIVAGAGMLFRTNGYEGVTMNSIAKAVGITAPALYWHFKSKEELCLIFLKRLAETLIEAVDRNIRSTHAHEQLFEFVQAHVLMQFEGSGDLPLVETPFSYGQFRMKLSPNLRDELDQLHDQLTRRLRDILLLGIEERVFSVHDVVASTYAILSLGEFVPAWYRIGGRLSPGDLASVHATLALRMAGYAPALQPGHMKVSYALSRASQLVRKGQ